MVVVTLLLPSGIEVKESISTRLLGFLLVHVEAQIGPHHPDLAWSPSWYSISDGNKIEDLLQTGYVSFPSSNRNT